MARRGGNNVCISKDGSRPWETSVYAVVRRATGIYDMSRGGNNDGPGPRQLQAKPTPLRRCGVDLHSTHTPTLSACKMQGFCCCLVTSTASPLTARPACSFERRGLEQRSHPSPIVVSGQPGQPGQLQFDLEAHDLPKDETLLSPCSKAALLIPRQSCTGPGRQAATRR
jgi:hypothetical protein